MNWQKRVQVESFKGKYSSNSAHTILPLINNTQNTDKLLPVGGHKSDVAELAMRPFAEASVDNRRLKLIELVGQSIRVPYVATNVSSLETECCCWVLNHFASSNLTQKMLKEWSKDFQRTWIHHMQTVTTRFSAGASVCIGSTVQHTQIQNVNT